jgi:hypothetical protein
VKGWATTDLGGRLLSQPAAVSWGPGRLDLFVRGTDASCSTSGTTGNRWSGWESLGGRLTSGLAVASWGSGRLDIFVRGADAALWHKW